MDIQNKIKTLLIFIYIIIKLNVFQTFILHVSVSVALWFQHNSNFFDHICWSVLALSHTDIDPELHLSFTFIFLMVFDCDMVAVGIEIRAVL